MKINNIIALDYQAQGTRLTLLLTGTSLEEITNMNTALLNVVADDGTAVECLVGYRLIRVTYEAADGTFTAVLELGVEDTAGEALKAMAKQLEQLDAAQKGGCR